MIIKKTITDDEVMEFAKNLRLADRDEIRLMSKTPADAIFTSAEATRYLYGVYNNAGKPLGICGISDRGDKDNAIVWLLSTPLVSNHPIEFSKIIKNLLYQHETEYSTFSNIMPVGSSNRKFVESLGFIFFDAEDELIEYNGHKFMRFEKRTERGLYADLN